MNIGDQQDINFRWLRSYKSSLSTQAYLANKITTAGAGRGQYFVCNTLRMFVFIWYTNWLTFFCDCLREADGHHAYVDVTLVQVAAAEADRLGLEIGLYTAIILTALVLGPAALVL